MLKARNICTQKETESISPAPQDELSPQERIKNLQERSKEKLDQKGYKVPAINYYIPKLLKNNESEAFNSTQKYIVTKLMKQSLKRRSEKHQ